MAVTESSEKAQKFSDKLLMLVIVCMGLSSRTAGQRRQGIPQAPGATQL